MKKFFSIVAAVLFAGSMMAADLLTIDFTQGQGEWTIDVKENPDNLDAVWAQDSRYGMKATAYVNSANHATEAWLISPVIDLSGASVATLAFSHARRYGDLEHLSVCAKAGEGEWTALEVSAWPDGSNWTFIDATADMSAFAGQAAVQIAFLYTSTADAAATWEIKTVAISDEGAVVPEEPVNLGEKTIAEFLELKNAKDTCILTGTIANIVMDKTDATKPNKYGNFDLVDETGTVYIYGLLTPAGEAQKFQEMGLVEGDVIIIKARYAEYNGKAQVQNAILVAKDGQGIENIVLTEKAQKVVVDGVIYIVRDNKMFTVQGTQVR